MSTEPRRRPGFFFWSLVAQRDARERRYAAISPPAWLPATR
jgi:hypothetical protein